MWRRRAECTGTLEGQGDVLCARGGMLLSVAAVPPTSVVIVGRCGPSGVALWLLWGERGGDLVRAGGGSERALRTLGASVVRSASARLRTGGYVLCELVHVPKARHRMR